MLKTCGLLQRCTTNLEKGGRENNCCLLLGDEDCRRHLTPWQVNRQSHSHRKNVHYPVQGINNSFHLFPISCFQEGAAQRILSLTIDIAYQRQAHNGQTFPTRQIVTPTSFCSSIMRFCSLFFVHHLYHKDCNTPSMWSILWLWCGITLGLYRHLGVSL